MADRDYSDGEDWYLDAYELMLTADLALWGQGESPVRPKINTPEAQKIIV
jgi:hypothetical protein